MNRLDRFWSKVAVVPGDGCWEWIAGLKGNNGYGDFSLGVGRNIGAHRFAWAITNGPIGDGLFVCHRCDNRKCVRPDHLFLGTAGDNNRDMFAKGRAKPTTPPKVWGSGLCRKGLHDITDPKNVMTGASRRRCRECWRKAQQDYRKLHGRSAECQRRGERQRAK